MYNTYVAASVLYTIPNPLVTVATPNVSTFHVTSAQFITEWTVRQDFRKQSVLNGLSAIGGLGSFLSTLLVIVLGSTIMQTVRGKKPYTPFGLFHNTEREQRGIHEECFKRYPGLREEIVEFSSSGNGKGVVAFLLDTLIDAENLGFKDLNVKSLAGPNRGHQLGCEQQPREGWVVRARAIYHRLGYEMRLQLMLDATRLASWYSSPCIFLA
ncbi:hypothetical protein FA13DRAFT_804397 [Coprinellus micaceus]|uniref:Uncharacterized protein n=1 Tax=Coprinellus micaceus TaxID=71717 RepID=A0A4Y7T2Y8_COPMI|nr:hypothetical protein FA13DRAFT_804397 [Coprinellus micaceus]